MNDKIDSANRKLQTDLFSVSTESWIKLKESLEAPKNAEYLGAQTYYDSTQTKISSYVNICNIPISPGPSICVKVLIKIESFEWWPENLTPSELLLCSAASVITDMWSTHLIGSIGVQTCNL